MRVILVLAILAACSLASHVPIDTPLEDSIEPMVSGNATSVISAGEGRILYRNYPNISNQSQMYLVFPNQSVLFSHELVFEGLELDYGKLEQNVFSMLGIPQSVLASDGSIQFFSHYVEACQQEFTPWEYPLISDSYEVSISDVDFSDTYIRIGEDELKLEENRSYNLTDEVSIHILDAVDGNSLVGEQDFTHFILTDMHFMITDDGLLENFGESRYQGYVDADFHDSHAVLYRISLAYITDKEYLIPLGSSLSSRYNLTIVDYEIQGNESTDYTKIYALQRQENLWLKSGPLEIPLFYQGQEIGLGLNESARLVASAGEEARPGDIILIDNSRLVTFEGCVNGTPVFYSDGSGYVPAYSYEASCDSVVFAELGNAGDQKVGIDGLNISFEVEDGLGHVIVKESKDHSVSFDYYPYYGVRELMNNGRELDSAYTAYGSYVALNDSILSLSIPGQQTFFNVSFEVNQPTGSQYIETCADNCYFCSNGSECKASVQDCLWSNGRCFALDPASYKEKPKLKPLQAKEVEDTWNTTSTANKTQEKEEEKEEMDLSTSARVMQAIGVIVGFVILVVVAVYFIFVLAKKRAEKRRMQEFFKEDRAAEQTVQKDETKEFKEQLKE